MQFGQKLVFDCSYDRHMSFIEAGSCATQLLHSFTLNRNSKDPFDLHYCNVNFNSPTWKRMRHHVPSMRNPSYPMHLHENSYLDLFPAERLVYLTPHCTNDLTEYDANVIYIVGAMVDKSNQVPLSSVKAQRENLKMARLPLDACVKWKSGTKFFTLYQMMDILLELKNRGGWAG